MRAAIPALLCTYLLSQAVTAGQYHICTDADGKKLFSQQPCPDNTSAEVKTYEHIEQPAQQPARVTTNNATYQAIKNNNRRLELERNIKKTERKIDKLQTQQATELKRLRSKKRYANNNAAGAAWEQSISTEMQAVTDRYNSMIRNERDDLAAMREELRNL